MEHIAALLLWGCIFKFILFPLDKLLGTQKKEEE